jgi:uncharacterized protein YnzC (UPF0291/DUF896 family)
MIKKYLTMIRWPLGCLIFLLAACNRSTAYRNLVITEKDSIAHEAMISRAFVQISQCRQQIHTGDLVTRTGNDFTSESLRSLNRRNKIYSHCGIASIEHDSIFIYHALGGEWNPDQKIRRDPLVLFAEPYSNNRLGIFRFTIEDSLKKNILETVRSYYTNGVMFDMDFDLKSDDHMYCAEFVYKCYARGSRGQLSFPHSFISAFEFIGVDDIFLHPQCHSVEEIVYK